MTWKIMSAANALFELEEGLPVLAAARSCAEVKIAIAPVGTASGVQASGAKELLGSTLLRSLRSDATAFVTLVDEGGLTDTSPTALKKVARYEVAVRLTAVTVDHATPKVTVIKTTGKQSHPCTKTRSDGTHYAADCEVDIPLSYELVSAYATATSTADVRIIDLADGSLVQQTTVRGTGTDTVEYARNPRLETGATAVLTTTGTDGTVSNGTVRSLLSQRASLTSDDVLVRTAVLDAGAAATAVVLSRLDAPAVLPDPSALTIKP
jgi:hypothetical protein